MSTTIETKKREDKTSLPSTAVDSEPRKRSATELNRVDIVDVQSLEGANPIGRKANMGQGSPKVTVLKADLHALGIHVKDVLQHGAAFQKASLHGRNPLAKDGFKNKPVGTRNESVIRVDHRKRASVGGSEHFAVGGVNKGRLLK